MLLGLAALLQLGVLDIPSAHPAVALLSALLLCPRPPKLHDEKRNSSIVAIGLIIALNMLSPWWLEKTGQALDRSPWFIVPLYLYCLYAMTSAAAETIQLKADSDITEIGKAGDTHRGRSSAP